MTLADVRQTKYGRVGGCGPTPSAGSMSGQRLRRWSVIDPALRYNYLTLSAREKANQDVHYDFKLKKPFGLYMVYTIFFQRGKG